MLMIFLLLFFSSEAQAMAEGTGLKFVGAADFTGYFGAKNQEAYPQRLDLREAEFGIYGPIDHGFEGALFFAAHNEGGEHHLEVEEAYLASSKLLPNVRLKAGKFFLGVGRLNQFHRHDWPFVTTPKVQEEFFAEEAASDTGGQANILFPFLPIYTELTLGLTNGWTFGHSHSEGMKPVRPTHYLRLANYFPLGETGGLQAGWNYLARDARDTGKMQIFGLDATAKWKEGAYTKWLVQAEAYGRNLRPLGGALSRVYGSYFYLQRHLSGPLDLGFRLDGYSIDTSADKNLDYSLVPTLVYRHSEFARFKAAYQMDYEKRGHHDSQVNRTLAVQAVFLLGDHPAHDF